MIWSKVELVLKLTELQPSQKWSHVFQLLSTFEALPLIASGFVHSPRAIKFSRDGGMRYHGSSLPNMMVTTHV